MLRFCCFLIIGVYPFPFSYPSFFIPSFFPSLTLSSPTPSLFVLSQLPLTPLSSFLGCPSFSSPLFSFSHFFFPTSSLFSSYLSSPSLLLISLRLFPPD